MSRWIAGAFALLACLATFGDSATGRRRLFRLSAAECVPARSSRGVHAIARLRRLLGSQPDGVRMPVALDVLAACLCAGAPVDHALSSVARAFDGEIGQLLAGVARLSVLGAPPEVAWAAATADARWAPVARAVIRAHYSGAALTDVLSRVADERRRALRADAEAAAGRAGVRAVLPLGLCFLPAFVLVGVVPVVAGFAGALWR